MSKQSKLVTRRDFLKKGLTFAAASATVPMFLSKTALAIHNSYKLSSTSSLPGLPDERVVVIVQLSGGNDGLNTVIPFSNDHYYKLRPSLAIPKNKVLRLNDDLGLHPNLSSLKNLYDDGSLNIVQGVGYPNPDRSHFRSMEIWQSGVAEGFETTGWIGRLFDHSCSNGHIDEACSPTLSVSVGNTLNPALRGNSGVGVAVQDPEQLYRMTRLHSGNSVGERNSKISNKASTLDFLRRTAMNAEISADKIRRSVRSVQNQTDYPGNPFAQGLKLIAGMIAGGLDAKVYYISLSGFDTHASQANVHERLLKTFGEGVLAFQKDLENLSQAERVLGVTFSEFGRRAAENGSRGSDHGKAAPMFLFGKSVKAGFTGEHPNLENLTDGDLQFHTDFRSVYAAILEDWLRMDSKNILGKQFQKVAIV